MDEFKTINGPAETKTVIKKSTFYAFSIPAETETEVEQTLKEFRKRFYDARHGVGPLHCGQWPPALRQNCAISCVGFSSTFWRAVKIFA